MPRLCCALSRRKVDKQEREREGEKETNPERCCANIVEAKIFVRRI